VAVLFPSTPVWEQSHKAVLFSAIGSSLFLAVFLVRLGCMPGARLWVLCIEIRRGLVTSRQIHYTLETSPHLPDGGLVQVLRRFVRLTWVDVVNIIQVTHISRSCPLTWVLPSGQASGGTPSGAAAAFRTRTVQVVPRSGEADWRQSESAMSPTAYCVWKEQCGDNIMEQLTFRLDRKPTKNEATEELAQQWNAISQDDKDDYAKQAKARGGKSDDEESTSSCDQPDSGADDPNSSDEAFAEREQRDILLYWKARMPVPTASSRLEGHHEASAASRPDGSSTGAIADSNARSSNAAAASAMATEAEGSVRAMPDAPDADVVMAAHRS
jgi:hypothetical protein